jgi:NADH-quinone oxidoreductase subunit J
MNSLAAQLAFYALALLTLVPAVLVVRSRSILHAGFWLLPAFIGIAGLYAALEAHFFFVVQILIYAGAILVLILFALMLTRDVMRPHTPQSVRVRLSAALICGALGLAAAYVLTIQTWPLTAAQPADPADQTRTLGEALIGLYAAPFEVASLLLLAALIGAIVLAKVEQEPPPEAPPLADTVREQG